MTDSDEVKLLPCEELVPAAAAIVDIWMGGDTAWRARLDDSDFLESADWQNALQLARAALATRPPVVTDEVVERVRAAICWAAAEHGIASDQTARAAISSMPAVVSGGQSDG